MNINPILTSGGGQALERRSSWMRTSETVDSRVGTMAQDETRARTEEPEGLGFTDQLSKGLVGRVATPEWQENIDLAQGVRVADQAMGEIDDELQQAKSDLTEIHKMFPPYPQESQERADYLNSFKSLRMQIDKLIIPPESDTAAQIMGGMTDGETPPEVGSFPVDPGSKGLDLLDPGKSVDELEDDELPAIIDDLERASGVLNERRTSLEASGGKVFNQGADDEVAFSKLSIEVQEQFATLDTSIARPETGVHQDLPFLD